MNDAIIKFEYEAKEMKKALIRMVLESDVDFTDIEKEDTRMIMSYLKLFDTSLELIVAQSKMIDDMNMKLDKLVAKLAVGS